VIVHGYPVSDVSKRLGIFSKGLYEQAKKFSQRQAKRKKSSNQRAEIVQLKRELKHSEQNRARLKEAAVFFTVE
jgi:transposase-like protein